MAGFLSSPPGMLAISTIIIITITNIISTT